MAETYHNPFASLTTIYLDKPIPKDLLQDALAKPPFILLPGSFNVRDVGTFAPGYVKPRTVFRSGMLDFIPQSNQPLLRSELGLSKIYDFRRSDEIKAPLVQVEGIEVLHCPYMNGEEAPPETDPANFALKDGETVGQGFRDMYDCILDGYTGGYREVFEALKTAKANDAVLFHCTGGKDRTGVMSALVLELMGAPIQVIADEYTLTRIGTEPFREKLLPALIKSMRSPDSQESAEEGTISPGLRRLLGSHYEVMVDFVERLRARYGGAEGYLEQALGFSKDDVEAIRVNLRPSTA